MTLLECTTIPDSHRFVCRCRRNQVTVGRPGAGRDGVRVPPKVGNFLDLIAKRPYYDCTTAARRY